MSHSLKITSNIAGLRVDRCLRAEFRGVPQSLIQKIARKGLLYLDGSKVGTKDKVRYGQTLLIKCNLTAAPREQVDRAPPPGAVEHLMNSILFEDDNIVVFNKSANLCTQGGSFVRYSVDSILSYVGRQKGLEYKLTHRIDRDTTGVLIVAKSRGAAAGVAEAFRSKNILKEYVALVWGVPPKHRRSVESVVNPKKIGPTAFTVYDVIASSEGMSFVKLKPMTGHKHQLRIHMAELGTPIVGDVKYGNYQLDRRMSRMYLHAYSAQVPGYKKMVAPLPDYFIDTMEKIGLSDVLHAL